MTIQRNPPSPLAGEGSRERGQATVPNATQQRAPRPITGVILAGGRGSRMGEVDKGLQLFRGRPMVEHVIERLRGQVDTIVINANRNVELYAGYGFSVFGDAIDGFAGPLAGLHAGLQQITTGLVVTTPCDSPFLPLDLVAQLAAPFASGDVDVAMAKTGDQVQPVFCMVDARVEPSLRAFLASGQRKIDKWTATLRTVEVSFDDEAAFANINTLHELAAFESPPTRA